MNVAMVSKRTLIATVAILISIQFVTAAPYDGKSSIAQQSKDGERGQNNTQKPRLKKPDFNKYATLNRLGPPTDEEMDAARAGTKTSDSMSLYSVVLKPVIKSVVRWPFDTAWKGLGKIRNYLQPQQPNPN